jgi:hypothetical protein
MGVIKGFHIGQIAENEMFDVCHCCCLYHTNYVFVSAVYGRIQGIDSYENAICTIECTSTFFWIVDITSNRINVALRKFLWNETNIFILVNRIPIQ